MIAIKNNNLALQVAKETGINVCKIAGLYLLNHTLSTKLKEITKDTSQLAAQSIRSLRSKYEEGKF